MAPRRKGKKAEMKYDEGSVHVPSITGALVGVDNALQVPALRAWQPSTWPKAPTKVDAGFIQALRTIFNDSMLGELRNVIDDAHKANGSLTHRGHVVAIALMCALDAISSYGYGALSGKQIPPFIKAHFPAEYHPFAGAIRSLYRNNLIHSWNLFPVSLLPGNEKVRKYKGSLSFGLLDFYGALLAAVDSFLKELETSTVLQTNTLTRYRKLRASARP